MKGKSRINAEERKKKIIEAAKPLFAKNGFNGTSIRDIARAADVSNALLYRHFPSKEAMYAEILNYSDLLYSKIAMKIKDLKPSTETLIFVFYTLYWFILFEVPGISQNQKEHERLLFYSLLENIDYAKKSLNKLYNASEDIVRKNFLAAEKSNDIIKIRRNRKNRLWFVHHLALGLNLCHISDSPAFDYDTDLENLIEDSVHFALRGIGLTDSAIKKYYKPQKLKEMMKILL